MEVRGEAALSCDRRRYLALRVLAFADPPILLLDILELSLQLAEIISKSTVSLLELIDLQLQSIITTVRHS